MVLIYFFIGLALVFLFRFILIQLMIKYLNSKPSIQEDIDSNKISSDDLIMYDRLKDFYKNFINFFDKEIIKIEVANKLIDEDYFDYIVVVRTKNEWNKGHYPTATHIPLEPQDEFTKNITYYNRKLSFLIYCKTDRRSKIAADIMKKNGFDNVRYLVGNYRRLNVQKAKKI